MDVPYFFFFLIKTQPKTQFAFSYHLDRSQSCRPFRILIQIKLIILLFTTTSPEFLKQKVPRQAEFYIFHFYLLNRLINLFDWEEIAIK